MKFIALCITAVIAQQSPGEYCDKGTAVCQETNSTCVAWRDGDGYPRKSCEDCMAENRILLDEYNREATFFCPGEEESSAGLFVSAAAVLGAAAMMA